MLNYFYKITKFSLEKNSKRINFEDKNVLRESFLRFLINYYLKHPLFCKNIFSYENKTQGHCYPGIEINNDFLAAFLFLFIQICICILYRYFKSFMDFTSYHLNLCFGFLVFIKFVCIHIMLFIV